MKAGIIIVILLIAISLPIWVRDITGEKSSGFDSIIDNHDYGIINTNDNPIHVEEDSLNVRLVGSWPSGPSYAVAVDGERDIVFVLSSVDSVFILDVSNPANPERLSAFHAIFGWNRYDLYYQENYLYVVEPSLMRIVSVENPRNPVDVGEVSYECGVYLQGVTVEDTIAYISEDNTGGVGCIQIASIAVPSNPLYLGETLQLDGTPWQIAIDDSLAYAAIEDGLLILSISDPSNLYEVGRFRGYFIDGVSLKDTIAYLTPEDIHIVSMANPSDPIELGSFSTPGEAYNLVINNDLIFLADGSGGLRVILITDPSELMEVGYYQSGYAQEVAYYEPYVYVAMGEGLFILEYFDPTLIDGKGGEDISPPNTFVLSQNFPNPFNPSTTIDYSVPVGKPLQIKLEIFDLRGRFIRNLVDEVKHSGHCSVHWDGKDEKGREVCSGTYLYRIIVGEFTSTKKMLILR